MQRETARAGSSAVRWVGQERSTEEEEWEAGQGGGRRGQQGGWDFVPCKGFVVPQLLHCKLICINKNISTSKKTKSVHKRCKQKLATVKRSDLVGPFSDSC